jgi:hypothetical protein
MDILNFTQEYWVVLVFVGTMIGNWFLLRNQMRLFDIRLKHLEVNSNNRNERDAETRAKLMVLENMLQNIDKNMADMKNDIRRVAEHQHNA